MKNSKPAVSHRHFLVSTRRTFLQASTTAATALVSLGKTRSGTTPGPEREFEYGSPLGEFSFRQIEFAPGLHQAQLELTHGILMGLDENSLLRPFRRAADLVAPGTDLGGWYSCEQFPHLRGLTFGQWISALSRYYAITGDEPTRAKVDRLVRSFSLTVKPNGKIYKGGFCAYMYDKLTCGLIEAHEFVRHPLALSMLSRVTNVAEPQLPGSAEDYTIPENQFIAWQRGGDRRYLELAKRYLYHDFFGPLARGEDVLAARHAYSHVNSLSSAAKAYLVLGDEQHLEAARNGFEFLEKQSFATGGWGPNESFLPSTENPLFGFVPIDTLGESLTQTRRHFETPCGAYAHFKLTRYLLRILKDPKYGDSMERVMYNTVLGAKPLRRNGQAFYYSDYGPDGHKIYLGTPPDGIDGAVAPEWPCCSGTLPQIAADYRISSYFHDADDIYVNLYIPSRLTWRQGTAHITLDQSGEYPLSDAIVFRLSSSEPTSFALRFRVPAWAESATIQVNGKRGAPAIRRGTFAEVYREWRSGDVIELQLPRPLRLEPADAVHPDLVALVSGPLVLFAVSDTRPEVTRAQLLAAKQVRATGPEWRAETATGPLRLVPFWAISDEMYLTYLTVKA